MSYGKPFLIGHVQAAPGARAYGHIEVARTIRGQLIAIPVVNTSAFEFAQRTTPWDNKDLNRQKRGNPRGTVTEQLASAFFEQALSGARGRHRA